MSAQESLASTAATLRPDEAAEVRRVRKVLAWYVRPLFILTVAVTLVGNLSQADGGAISLITHAWAPVIYLFSVELLAFRVMAGVWAWWASAFVAVLGAVSFAVSFTYLRTAALEAGWTELTSAAFPVLVDAFALALTAAMQGASARVRGIQDVAERRFDNEAIQAARAEEAERSKGGRPAIARARKEVERAAAEIRTASEPSVRHSPTSGLIVERFGPDPDTWPSVRIAAEQLGKSPSTVSDGMKRARTVLEAVSEVPKDVAMTT